MIYCIKFIISSVAIGPKCVSAKNMLIVVIIIVAVQVASNWLLDIMQLGIFIIFHLSFKRTYNVIILVCTTFICSLCCRDVADEFHRDHASSRSPY